MRKMSCAGPAAYRVRSLRAHERPNHDAYQHSSPLVACGAKISCPRRSYLDVAVGTDEGGDSGGTTSSVLDGGSGGEGKDVFSDGPTANRGVTHLGLGRRATSE